MTRYSIFFALLLLTGLLQAQTAFDAFRFSFYPETGGTARTMGVGGGIGALGADFAVLSTNPAGLASFRRSEFTFSPEIYSSRIKSLLKTDEADNEVFTEDRSGLNINNLGLVISARPMASKWKTINFGIGMNRIASFSQTQYFAGTSPGSITDRFLENANGLDPEELGGFEEGLAYDVGAIFPDQNNPGSYFSDFFEGELVDKQQVIQTGGSISEMVFSVAGNYEEKLQLGMTIGVPFLSFSEDKTYQETDDDDRNAIFNELIYQENLRITGTGINLKLGLIYKPVHAIRIGAAFHTPTSFSIDDSYSTSMTYDYTLGGNNRFDADSPEGFYEYRLRTPWRVMGSTGLLFDKLGFITAEVEYADYGNAAFNFNQARDPEDQAYEQALNRDISRTYNSAFIVRFGGELALDLFRLRAGYNLITNPVAAESYTRGAWSAGFGVREKGFFLDLAYRRSATDATYFPYLTEELPQPEVEMRTIIQHFLLTTGFKF